MNELREAYKNAVTKHAAQKEASLSSTAAAKAYKVLRSLTGNARRNPVGASTPIPTGGWADLKQLQKPLMQKFRRATNTGVGGLVGFGADTAVGAFSGTDTGGIGTALGLAGGALRGTRGKRSLLSHLRKGNTGLHSTARHAAGLGAVTPLIRGTQNLLGSDYDPTRTYQTMIRPAKERQMQLEQELAKATELRNKFRWLTG